MEFGHLRFLSSNMETYLSSSGYTHKCVSTTSYPIAKIALYQTANEIMSNGRLFLYLTEMEIDMMKQKLPPLTE